MATTTKVFVQIGDEVIELTGKEKEAYLAQKELDKTAEDLRKANFLKQIELKKSAYTKLGLTEEEIKSIL